MPWMVLFFGILVVPLGLVSITLVILQPVAVGAWCTLCLLTATAMLLMIPLTVDEVVAMLQFMVRAVRDGQPFWRTFWRGGTLNGGEPDERSPALTTGLRESAPAMVWGVSVPWTLLASTLIGLWWIAGPDVLGIGGPAADNSHLVGAATVCVAVVSMAEVVRPGRLLNVTLGLWMAAVPWLIGGGGGGATNLAWSNLISGVALAALSVPRGAMREQYGGWDRYARWPQVGAAKQAERSTATPASTAL